MKRGNILTIWREKLAISQKALAEFFGISRSHLSMIELGERQLPTQALLDFHQLIGNYKETPRETLAAYTPQERTAMLEMLNKEIDACTWKLEKCHEELARMENDYLAGTSSLQLWRSATPELAANATSTSEKKKKLWLELQGEEATKRVEHASAVARLVLQYRIEMLQASIQVAQRMASTL